MSINSRTKAAQIDREYAQKESLIQQAKLAYTKKTLPPQKKTDDGDGTRYVNCHLGFDRGLMRCCCWTVVTDPTDDRFDLEAYLTKMTAEESKQA